MKTRILAVICVVLLIFGTVMAVLYAGAMNREQERVQKTAPLFAVGSSENIQFKLALLHLYSESNNIISTLPFTTIQLTQTALMMALMNDSSATQWLNKNVDQTLDAANKTFDEILSKYKDIIAKYNMTSYNTKYNELSGNFSSLKNSASTLISQTRTLIKQVNSSSYTTSYNLYVNQLNDLTTKIESYLEKVQNEYNSLLSDISDDYDKLK